jgi:hypothetical protein
LISGAFGRLDNELIFTISSNALRSLIDGKAEEISYNEWWEKENKSVTGDVSGNEENHLLAPENTRVCN